MTTIAVIGLGYMGRTHVASWAAQGLGGRIKYICTPRTSDSDSSAPSATIVSDYGRVLADPEVDVVSICTPTPTHRDLAVRALRAGKHVLLEKPIALTLDDAVAIQESAEESGTVLMVAHVVRFFQGYRRLRTDVEAGALGAVLSARARRFINRPTWAEWWHDEAKSGGVPVDFAIHDYDQMNLFLGSPRMVRCSGQNRLGPIETIIEYQDGGLGQVLSYADLATGAPFTSSISLVGTRGFADYEFLAGSPTETAGSAELASRSRYRLAVGGGGGGETELGPEDPYAAQVGYFLRCITDKEPPVLSDAVSAIRALQVSLAARESLSSGGAVLVKPFA